MPKMYDELAAWWPLLSPRRTTRRRRRSTARTLEEACERRAHAAGARQRRRQQRLASEEALRDDARRPSAGMLAVSRALNPECEHVEGDMRTVRLGREFDAVFVHDAVCYLTTEDDLRRAIETAFVHCGPAARRCSRRTTSARTSGRPPITAATTGSRGAPLPGVDVGSRSDRHDVPRRLRLPAADARRIGPRRPRPARRRSVRACGLVPLLSRRWLRGT